MRPNSSKVIIKYIKHKNITTVTNRLQRTLTVHTVKITHRSSVGLGPNDTTVIHNFKKIKLYLSWRMAQEIWRPMFVCLQDSGCVPSLIRYFLILDHPRRPLIVPANCGKLWQFWCDAILRHRWSGWIMPIRAPFWGIIRKAWSSVDANQLVSLLTFFKTPCHFSWKSITKQHRNSATNRGT